MASKDTIAIAVKIAGRAAASGEVNHLRKDLRGVGDDAAKGATGADRAMDKVQRSVKKTGDETEKQAPRIAKASKPLATMARRAAGAGAALLSIHAANQAVETLEELGASAMGLAGNFGFTEQQAGRWAAVAKVRNLAPKALNQSFGTLAKNVSAVGPAVQKHGGALDKLSKQQKKQLREADGITNAQKREEKQAKILSSFQEKRAAISGKSLGKQADALAAFGISSKEAAGANDDMYGFLLKVADGYEKLGPGTNRSALAMSLFGKGWQTLRPLLSKGSEGLKEQLDDVDRLGGNVAKTTGSLGEHIVAQRKQKLAMLGIQVQMGTVLLPLYKKGAELTSKLAIAGNKAWPTIEKEIGPVVDATEKVVTMTARFVEKHPELIKIAAGFVAVATAVRGIAFAGKVSGINAVVKALIRMRRASKAAALAGEAAAPGFADGFRRGAGKVSPQMLKVGKMLGKTVGVGLAAAAIYEIVANRDKIAEAIGGQSKPVTKSDGTTATAVNQYDAIKHVNSGNFTEADLKVLAANGRGKGMSEGEIAKLMAEYRKKPGYRKRAKGGFVQPGEMTLLGEDGPEPVRLPPGSQVFPTNHPWSNSSARRDAAPAAASSGAAGMAERFVILNRVYLKDKVLYEAFSDQHEREALKK